MASVFTKVIKKEDKTFRFFLCVDYGEKLSNLFEDLKKLDDFAQRVEYLSVKDGGGKIVVEKQD
jgi:hypothetical protein